MAEQQLLFTEKNTNPMDKDLPIVVQWLEKMNFTGKGNQYDSLETSTIFESCQNHTLAAPTKKGVKKLTQVELDALKKRYKNKKEPLAGIEKSTLYGEIRSPEDTVRTLDLKRLPADAMAFYRYYHCVPFDQWGIYLLVDKLLKYNETLSNIISNRNIFSPSTLMHYILFEIFHHEFFHHIAESTATSLEIIFAGIGNPRSIFLEYNHRKCSKNEQHEHSPLEEALANAYAYNSLSFISRYGMAYKTGAIRVFQAAIKKYWENEPRGYCSAHHYIHEKYIEGGAHLLALMMNAPNSLMEVPLTRLSKSVMPSGFSAFVAKPNIPTYLVGSPENLALFYTLVPAPNEAYTKLYWPYDTTDLDNHLKQEKKKEQESKKRKSGR